MSVVRDLTNRSDEEPGSVERHPPVVAMLSQWPSLRAVSRLDLATVLRERAT